MGIQLPNKDNFPDMISKLFQDGITIGTYTLKFWQIVNAVIISLVIIEAFRYNNTQKALGGTASPMTLGVFIFIIATLGVMSFPELLGKLKGNGVLSLTNGSLK